MSAAFKDRVKQLRRDKGWSKSELARRAGVTTTAVWNWEVNGRTPRPETMARIAKAFGLTEETLQYGTKPLPANGSEHESEQLTAARDRPLHLTIADAKRALAASFGVSPENVEITIRG